MKRYKIVVDTNVIVSALKSRNGYSFKLLKMIDNRNFALAISVPIIFEYEYAISNNISEITLAQSDIDSILDYICFIGEKREIFYLWRPFLSDPKDDMFLETAVESNSDYIITFNKKDFQGIEKFNIKTVTPKEFLTMIGDKL